MSAIDRHVDRHVDHLTAFAAASHLCLQANPARVRQQLLTEGVELEEAGGAVQVVEVAAAKGVGLQELEDALLLQVATQQTRNRCIPAHTRVP